MPSLQRHALPVAFNQLAEILVCSSRVRNGEGLFPTELEELVEEEPVSAGPGCLGEWLDCLSWKGGCIFHGDVVDGAVLLVVWVWVEDRLMREGVVTRAGLLGGREDAACELDDSAGSMGLQGRPESRLGGGRVPGRERPEERPVEIRRCFAGVGRLLGPAVDVREGELHAGRSDGCRAVGGRLEEGLTGLSGPRCEVLLLRVKRHGDVLGRGWRRGSFNHGRWLLLLLLLLLQRRWLFVFLFLFFLLLQLLLLLLLSSSSWLRLRR